MSGWGDDGALWKGEGAGLSTYKLEALWVRWEGDEVRQLRGLNGRHCIRRRGQRGG